MGEAHKHHRHREDTMTRPRRRPLALVNAFTRWILHVPLLRRLADRQVCELRFSGVKTGRPVVLPVMYARRADRVVVLVGGAGQKTWWRNFLGEGGPITLLKFDGQDRTGHAIASRDEKGRVKVAVQLG